MNFLKTFRQADGDKASQQPASQPAAKAAPQDPAQDPSQHQYYEVDDQYDTQDDNDNSVSMHYLMETAMAASRDYKILPLDEIEALRQDLDALPGRIDAVRHQLDLATKVRDARRSAARLPTHGRGASADGHADDHEVTESARKCDELRQELGELERRRHDLQTRLLEHTAGVLQATHKGYLRPGPEPARDAHDSGFLDDFGDASQYRPYTNFLETGLGFGEPPEAKAAAAAAAEAAAQQQGQVVLDVERRVEELNERLREMILEFRPNKLDLPQPARELRDDPDHPSEVLLDQVDFMEQCLNSLDHLQKTKALDHDAVSQDIQRKVDAQGQFVADVDRRVEDLNVQLRGMILDMKPAKEDLPDPARELRDDPNNAQDVLEGQLQFLESCLEAMKRLQERDRLTQTSDLGTEERLENINTQLFQLMTKHNPEKAAKYTPPPEAQGQSLPDQLDYLEGGLGAVNKSLAELHDEADAADVELAQYQERAEKYATVVGGLWDTLNPPPADAARDPDAAQRNAAFSLTAFEAQVQDAHRRYAALEDQKTVLTKQIQQQRELNATADTAKDAKLTEARERLERAETELAAHRAQAVDPASHDELKASTAAREAALSAEVEAKAAAAEAAEAAQAELEGEVVRLRTELAMAKAEIDSAHGTRAQRAAEAQAGEATELRARLATLQGELADTIADYEAMTRASIEFEREREQLEAAADALRDRAERLEAQLAEERIQGLGGVKSPPGGGAGGSAAGAAADKSAAPAGTGAAVLKAEFRKMMRETRLEHSKALRAEQDERRRLESMVRSLKKELGPSKSAAATAK